MADQVRIISIQQARDVVAVFFDQVGQPYTRPVQCVALVEYSTGIRELRPVVFCSGAACAEPLLPSTPDYLGICEGEFRRDDWLDLSERQKELTSREARRFAKVLECARRLVDTLGRHEQSFVAGDVVHGLTDSHCPASKADAERVCAILLDEGTIRYREELYRQGPFVVAKTRLSSL